MAIRCRLCEDELTTQNKCDAHILPRGMLKVLAPTEYGNLLIVGTDMPKQRAPIGTYDNKILCNACDNKLGEYDEYATAFVQNAALINHPSGLGWHVNGYDQEKLKLFFISYLWRGSITERNEYDGVKLGDKHEAKMRTMLLEQSAGSIDDYTVVLSRFESAKQQVGGLLIPAKTRLNNIVYYQGYLPRLFQFWIKVDARPDTSIRAVSLGNYENIFVHNKGDFDLSTEKKIMLRAVNFPQNK